MRRLRPTGEDGAYAILYGLLLMVTLGMAALVVDLGVLRQSRRETRLASDAAAVAGARELDIVAGTGNPREACNQAWSYLATNLGFTVPGATGCTDFPTSAVPCPAGPTDAQGTVGKYTVVVTWPVPNNSTLLLEPDVKPAADGVTDQAYDPELDGTDPCARIAVQVQSDEEAAFASIFGADGASTVVTSVARATSKPGVGGPIAALNVLETTRCNAIVNEGLGSIEIANVGDRPGIIAVESSGRDTSGVCPASRPWVINAAVAAAGGHIWANGPVTPTSTGVGEGTILSYAMNDNPIGNKLQAYNPATVPPIRTVLQPKPELMEQRFGVTPVTNIYNCTTPLTCTDGGGPYLNQLDAAYGGAGLPGFYAGSVSPYGTTAFQTVSAATVPGWPGCTIGNGDSVRVPAGNWYVDCDSLSVSGRLVFTGGNVVVRGKATGGVEVKTSGCLAFNVPVATATCPTVVSGAVVPAATKESILFLRAGNLTKGSQASLFTERTFTYVKNGIFDLGGGGTGMLYMTNPLTVEAGCDATCKAKRFSKMTLWSPSSSDHSVGGQSGLSLRGVLFTPNAAFTYAGGSAIVQTSAQFWAKTLRMTGQGTLRMAPDPTSSVERPELSTALIR